MSIGFHSGWDSVAGLFRPVLEMTSLTEKLSYRGVQWGWNYLAEVQIQDVAGRASPRGGGSVCG